jgi:hypothetical protein
MITKTFYPMLALEVVIKLPSPIGNGMPNTGILDKLPKVTNPKQIAHLSDANDPCSCGSSALIAISRAIAGGRQPVRLAPSMAR